MPRLVTPASFLSLSRTPPTAFSASPKAAPRVGQVLSSRVARWIATLAVAFLVFLAGSRLRDGFQGFSLRGPSHPQPGPSRTGTVPSIPFDNIDWSQYAYIQYVTNSEYLCNSVMIFESLHRLGSLADRVMMYPSHMFDPADTEADSNNAKLIMKARDEYNVKLMPITVQHRPMHDPTWADSFTKLLAFNATQYTRVLSLDSDSLLLQTMDELFLLPPCPVAMPRAYWLYPDNKILSSQLMLVQPDVQEFSRVMDKIDEAEGKNYDMEIVNDLYMDTAMILPHRPYNVLTSEWRHTDGSHVGYLGSELEPWDPIAAYNEAKFVHFSDWPVPKPWLATPEGIRKEKEPPCQVKDGTEDCLDRDLWNGFYADFRDLRKRVCKT